MNYKNIDKFLNFLEKEVLPPIKKDIAWLGKNISGDLEKLTKDKKQVKKNKKKFKK